MEDSFKPDEPEVEQCAAMRETLDRRYHEITSGKVKLIPGEEVEAHFREKSAARRGSHPGS